MTGIPILHIHVHVFPSTGAFLVPYTLSLILLGIPVFGLEVSFGQFGGRGPISIWGINPSFKGDQMVSCSINTRKCEVLFFV